MQLRAYIIGFNLYTVTVRVKIHLLTKQLRDRRWPQWFDVTLGLYCVVYNVAFKRFNGTNVCPHN